MDKKTIVTMSLLVLLSATIFGTMSIKHAAAQSSSPVHNLNTGLSYPSIQDAINAPQTTSGNTILVDPGTYTGQVVVNKTLTLVGANPEATVLDGQGTAEYLFQVLANGVNIENFTLKNTDSNPLHSSPAIRIFNVENVTVERVVIINVVIGVEVNSANFTTITECKIYQSQAYGIFVHSVSCNNTIVANTLEMDTSGTAISFASSGSMFNRVFHNNFVDNVHDVYLVATNYFDDGYPSGGNYWSKYTGLDLNHGPSQDEPGSDGIGDTHYIGDVEDAYPLMGNFSDHSVSSGVKTYEMEIASNSTISGFEFSVVNRTIRFNVFGTGGTGFCRISIPYGLVLTPYNVTVDGLQNPYNDVYDNGTFRWVYFAYNNTQHTVMIQSAVSIRVQNPTEFSPAYVYPGTTLVITTIYTETSTLNLTIEVFNSTSIINSVTVTGDLQNGTDVTRSDELLLGSWVTEGFYNVNATLFNTADMSRQATETNSIVVDVTPPTIGDVSQNPPADSVYTEDAVTVNVEVTDALSGLRQVTLSYITDDGLWTGVAMTNLLGNIYNATIPSLAFNTNVTYVITAEDNANNIVTTQDLGYMFHYRVVPEFPTASIILAVVIAGLWAVTVSQKMLFRRKSTCA